jgi:cytochrome bd-type quinol oxidase subunit 1
MAMWMAALVTPIQIFVGDLHGLNTLERQPAKIAAMEGHYDPQVRRSTDPLRHSGRRSGEDALRAGSSKVGVLDSKARAER